MGCDIHMVLEIKDKTYDKWIGLHNYPYFEPDAFMMYISDSDGVPNDLAAVRGMNFIIRSRDYRMFAELAGVRGHSYLGNKPNGVPKDASDLSLREIANWGSDGHSHSHLSLDDFIKCVAVTEGRIQNLVEHRIAPTQDTKKYVDELRIRCTGLQPGDYDGELRIVFWFDN